MMNNQLRRIQKSRKLVVVGDGMVGKTCLLYAFQNAAFDPSCPPTIFETYAIHLEHEGKAFTMALFDTAGQETYARLRPLSYSDTNVVLICFSVDNPTSATNVTRLWSPEIRHFCGPCPIILVGCKIDLRTNPHIIEKLKRSNEKPVTTESGKQIATQIKADAYMECSAKTQEGVQDLLMHAARLSWEKKSPSRTAPSCLLI